MQYKIPQDVGIADKIVGPLTLRQLIIIAVGGGISYVLFALASKMYEMNILEYIIVALPGLMALAAAFIKINNIPFTQFVLLSLEYAIKPKKRIWNHSGISGIVAPDLAETKTEIKSENQKLTKGNVNLDELSRILDSGGFENIKEIKHEDIDVAEDDDLMIQAFFGKKDGGGENMWMRNAKDKKAYERKLKLLSALPKTEVKALRDMKEQIAEVKRLENRQEQKITIAPQIKTQPISPETAGQTKPEIIPQAVKNPRPVPQQAPRINIQQPKQTENLTRIVPQTDKKPQPAVQQQIKQANADAQKPQQSGQTQPSGKKKRHRKKKSKSAGPVRPETRINNTQKQYPVKLMPKQPVQPPRSGIETKKTPSPKIQAGNKGGEISFEELKKGEIQLNLD